MKLIKGSTALLMALSLGTVVAAEGDSSGISTNSSNPNTYGGAQDVPAYQMPNNDGGIELNHNSASSSTSSSDDSGATNAPADLSSFTHSNTPSRSSQDQGANNADSNSAGSGYSSGFEGSK